MKRGAWFFHQPSTIHHHHHGPSAFRHLPSAILALCLPLTACQDNTARQQNADLQRRVAALEAEVQALKAAQANADSVNAPTKTEVGHATTRAAAQNCAFELARNLEDYHQSSLQNRYPTRTELTLPDSCSDQYVKWEKLAAQAYAFSVNNAAGQELARQSGP